MLFRSSFQNRDANFNNPINWLFQGSNDGSTFYELDYQYVTTQCASGMIRSFPVISDQSFSYFRLVFSGTSCDNTQLFNIAEFELFGSLNNSNENKSCNCHKEQHNFLSYKCLLHNIFNYQPIIMNLLLFLSCGHY